MVLFLIYITFQFFSQVQTYPNNIYNDETECYQFRTDITVENLSGESQREILIEIDTVSLFDGGLMFSAECNDMRFKFSTSHANWTDEALYWIESSCYQRSTKIWVDLGEEREVGDGENTTLFMYTGCMDESTVAREVTWSGYFMMPANDDSCPGKWMKDETARRRFWKIDSTKQFLDYDDSESLDDKGKFNHSHEAEVKIFGGPSNITYMIPEEGGVNSTDSDHTHYLKFEFDDYMMDIDRVSRVCCTSQKLDISRLLIAFYEDESYSIEHYEVDSTHFNGFFFCGSEMDEKIGYANYNHSHTYSPSSIDEIYTNNTKFSTIEYENTGNSVDPTSVACMAPHKHTIDIETSTDEFLPLHRKFNFVVSTSNHTEITKKALVPISSKPPFGWILETIYDNNYIRASSGSTQMLLHGSQNHTHTILSKSVGETECTIPVKGTSSDIEVSTSHKHNETELVSEITGKNELPRIIIHLYRRKYDIMPQSSSIKNLSECLKGYEGVECQYPICYEHSIDTGYLCSGHGDCLSPNNCDCNTGYGGENCQYFFCDGILSNETDTVCSGKGDCNGIDECKCETGYDGSNCSIELCGIDKNGSMCSGIGECSKVDDGYGCICGDDYGGDICQYPICGGVISSEENVNITCNGKGTCIAPNDCECNENYFGNYCNNWYCYSISKGDGNVCNGNGDCTEPDNCECNEYYSGSMCQTKSFDGLNEQELAGIIGGTVIGLMLIVILFLLLFVCIAYTVITIKKRKNKKTQAETVEVEMEDDMSKSDENKKTEEEKKTKEIKEEKKEPQKKKQKTKKGKKHKQTMVNKVDDSDESSDSNKSNDEDDKRNEAGESKKKKQSVNNKKVFDSDDSDESSDNNNDENDNDENIKVEVNNKKKQNVDEKKVLDSDESSESNQSEEESVEYRKKNIKKSNNQFNSKGEIDDSDDTDSD